MTTQKLCPYCGELLAKKPNSIDHIIPKQIGGCYKFTLLSCEGCNSEIGKIEQAAMQTLVISHLLAEMGEAGFHIKTRRKRDFIPLQKSVGLSCRVPAKMFYSNNTHERQFVFLSPPAKEILDRGSFNFIVPAAGMEDSQKDEISLLCLANKIVLGTCAWLWRDDFSNTKNASLLRNSIRNVMVENILTLDSSERHLELSDDPGKDAMDNRPHHSVYIGKLESKVVGLINLFGSFESMNTIGDYDDNFRNWIGDSGVVIISKTTTNEVLKMTGEDYERFKSNTKNSKLG